MRKLLFFFASVFCAWCAGAETFQWKLAGDRLTLTVERGCYVYASSVEIAPKPEKSPETILHTDAFSGKKTAVFGAGTHVWRFAAPPPKAEVAFQGCRDAAPGVPAQCFLPQDLTLEGEAGSVTAPSPDVPGAGGARFAGFSTAKLEGYADADAFLQFLRAGEAAPEEGLFAGRGMFVVILLVLLGGLGLNLTPCVLPLIPINLAILGADGRSAKSGFVRGAFYGLGMALAYGMLGVLVLLTGARMGTLNSSAFFNFGIALVFAMLGLAMFEVFNLDFSRFQSKFNPDRLGRGKILTAFILGAVAALLAGACVAPVVIGVLLFSGNLYASGARWALFLPFLLGLGMALPWPFAGAGLAIIPKPGRYMVRIKQFFGVVILLAALYYAYTGYTLLPLDSASKAPAAELEKLDAALSASRRDGKKVLIDFWASWCKNCLAMERTTFRDPRVAALLEKDFIVVKIQTEKPSDPAFAPLLDELKITGLPAFVIASPAK